MPKIRKEQIWSGTATDGYVLTANGAGGTAWEAVSGSGGDTAPADIYIATTGNDTTGDGTVGTPYATLGKAVSLLPATLGVSHTIHVADGTYTEAIDIRGHINGAGVLLKIQGNGTTPANVVFTGTVTVDSNAYGCYVRGPVRIELEGVKVNPAACYVTGYFWDRAYIVLDRCLFTGAATWMGLLIDRYTWVEVNGNLTVTGWATFGIQVIHHSTLNYLTAGTLTVTGPGANAGTVGVQVVYNSAFWTYGVADVIFNISATLIGVEVNCNSVFQNYGTGTSAATISNASKEANSWAIYVTDHAECSFNVPLTLTNWAIGFLGTSGSYMEALSTVTLTTVDTPIHVRENSNVTLTSSLTSHPGGPSDRRPTAPTAQDDEFDHTVLNTKWTRTSTAAADNVDTTWASHAYANFTNNQLYTLKQTYAAAATFSLTACFRVACQADYQGCGIYVYDSDESDCVRAYYNFATASVTANLATKDATVWTYGRSSLTVPSMTTVYLHIQRASNVWGVWVSFDGFSFFRVGTYSKTMTVDHFTLGIEQNGATVPVRMGIDWVRRDWVSL